MLWPLKSMCSLKAMCGQFQRILMFARYPNNNCAKAFPDSGFGDPIDPESVFPSYLTHASGQSIVQPYLNSTSIARQMNKPFYMMETNSASCGGFPGLSDSFGAALWMVDYGLQMAFAGFAGALLHVGGTSDAYNVRMNVFLDIAYY